MDHDLDDPPPQWSATDYFWQVMNRAAEWAMFTARLYSWKETKMFHCEAPGCMRVAGMRRKFLDPRRSHDVICEYTEKYYCSDECEYAIVEELERQAQYLRVAPEDAARKVS